MAFAYFPNNYRCAARYPIKVSVPFFLKITFSVLPNVFHSQKIELQLGPRLEWTGCAKGMQSQWSAYQTLEIFDAHCEGNPKKAEKGSS